MSFPQLDYADYISGDPIRREAFAKAIAQSFEVYGFATVRGSRHSAALGCAVFLTWTQQVMNHGVTKEEVDQAFKYVQTIILD